MFQCFVIGEPLPAKTLRAWAAFLKSDDASHFEVRDAAFYTLTEEQLAALKASASEFPMVPSAPPQMQGLAPNFPPSFGQPYGYQPYFDPHGMHSMPGTFPYGFHSAFSPFGGFAGPGMSSALPSGVGPALGPGMAPGYPGHLHRPSTVQVSEIIEQPPHVSSLMKHNPKLFDALVATYPNKCIPLLSAAQLKALVNKYGKECEKQPPPPTRSRRAPDASEPKKKSHKRRAEHEVEDDADDAEDADDDAEASSSKQDKAGKAESKAEPKAKKADKTDKAKKVDRAKEKGKKAKKPEAGETAEEKE